MKRFQTSAFDIWIVASALYAVWLLCTAAERREQDDAILVLEASPGVIIHQAQGLNLIESILTLRAPLGVQVCDKGIWGEVTMSVAARIPAINRLRNAKWISFSATELDDDRLARLRVNPTFEELHLSDTDITDASIPYLAQWKSLKLLNLDDTFVSPDGLRRLQLALPTTQVRRNLREPEFHLARKLNDESGKGP